MKELGDGIPYIGQTIVFKEISENPYFAYAGREILLIIKFIVNSLKEFDDGFFPFGCIHDLGHYFDNSIGQ